MTEGIWLSWQREWLTRSGVIVTTLLALGTGVLLQGEQRIIWGFILLCALPVLSVGLGASGALRADRSWSGLGGTTGQRFVGRVGLHLGLLGLLCAGAWFMLIGYSFESLPLHLVLHEGLFPTVIVLYLTTALVRRARDGGAMLVGPLLAVVLIGVGVVDGWLGRWSQQEGLMLRLALLLPAGLGALWATEDRLLSPRYMTWLWLGSLGVAALPLLPQALWNGRPLTHAMRLVAVQDDGEKALYMPADSGFFGSRRALLWDAGTFAQVGPAGVRDGTLLANGGIALLLDDGPDGALHLITPNGEAQTCAIPAMGEVLGVWGVVDDGVAVWVQSEGAAKLVIARTTGVCAFHAKPQGEAEGFNWQPVGDGYVWLRPQRPSLSRGVVLEDGVLQGGAAPVRGGALLPTGGLALLMHDGRAEQLRLWDAAGQLHTCPVPRSRPIRDRWGATDDGVAVPLWSEGDLGVMVARADGTCSFDARPAGEAYGFTWQTTQDGKLQIQPAPAQKGSVLVDPNTGRYWSIPDADPHTRVVAAVFHGDQARAFCGNKGILELGKAGLIQHQPLTLLSR